MMLNYNKKMKWGYNLIPPYFFQFYFFGPGQVDFGDAI